MKTQTTDKWQDCPSAWFFILDTEREKKKPNRRKISEAIRNLARLGYAVSFISKGADHED